jgi:hypothetical protein
MPLVCPRCQRTNPDLAVYCYFDGADLKSRQAPQQAQQQLPREFVFPSGKRCRSFDELAEAIQDEWEPARDLLKRGVFHQFFGAVGRADLAYAAHQATAQTDLDAGLTTFLQSLPATRTAEPKLDIHPRRLVLDKILAGEHRQVQISVQNQGQGVLHGTLTVSAGGEWLRLRDGNGDGECTLKVPRKQQIGLQVDTRGLAAGQTYGGKLTLISNGGAAEVPVRLDLGAHLFPKGPFQGAKAPRELAERMKAQPKAAVPLLESGEVSRWFAQNGWNYPVRGPQAKGVASVQQFFENLGLAKPPTVQLSQTDMQLHGAPGREPIRAQVTLQTPARKWVYAQIESDAPWLKILTPAVAGPQQAVIQFEADPRRLAPGKHEATVQVLANAGQKLSLQVRLSVRAAPQKAGRRVLRAVVGCSLAFLLVRALFAPLADLHARGQAADAAVAHSLLLAEKNKEKLRDTLGGYGGWLQLPWTAIASGVDTRMTREYFGEDSRSRPAAREFQSHVNSYFVRDIIFWTWWLGTVAGGWLALRRGSSLDVPFGLVAGTVAGVIVAASAACVILSGDLVPLSLWGALVGKGTAALLPVWILLALGCWTAMGALAGLALTLAPPARPALDALGAVFAGLFRGCGLRGPAKFFAVA